MSDEGILMPRIAPTWTVTDNLPTEVPATEAEIDVFEARLGASRRLCRTRRFRDRRSPAGNESDQIIELIDRRQPRLCLDPIPR